MKLLLHGIDRDGNEIFSEELDGNAFYNELWVIEGIKNGYIKVNDEYYQNSKEGLAFRKSIHSMKLSDEEKNMIFNKADDDMKALLTITKNDYYEVFWQDLDELYSHMDSESPGIIPDIYNIISENIKKIKRYEGKIMFDKIN